MFQSTTIFDYQGKNLEIDIDEVDAGIVLTRMDETISADNSTEANVSAVKTVIDDLVLRPLIGSFTNPEISEGLRKEYGLWNETGVDEITEAAANLEKVLTDNVETHAVKSLLADSLACEVMNDLDGRGGVLDGVDAEIREEMQHAISRLILKGVTSF